MRFNSLTALFFALFALFSTMAYAAPVAPQGATLQRRCYDPGCRDATPPPAGSTSNSRFDVITSILDKLLSLMGSGNDTPKNDLAVPTTTVVTAASSSAAPASDPTGV